FVSGLLVAAGLLVPLRAAGYLVMRRRAFADRVLVLGSGTQARRVIHEIESRPNFRYAVVSMVDDGSGMEHGDLPYPILGPLDRPGRHRAPHGGDRTGDQARLAWSDALRGRTGRPGRPAVPALQVPDDAPAAAGASGSGRSLGPRRHHSHHAGGSHDPAAPSRRAAAVLERAEGGHGSGRPTARDPRQRADDDRAHSVLHAPVLSTARHHGLG